MRKLLDFGNLYAKNSSWKDFALVKFCLFAMGLTAGMRVPEKSRKAVIGIVLTALFPTSVAVSAREALQMLQLRQLIWHRLDTANWY